MIPARYSIPFFVAPDIQGLIEPQPTLVAARGSSEFAPIIFKDYANRLLGLIEDEAVETMAKTVEKDVADNAQGKAPSLCMRRHALVGEGTVA